MTIDELEEFEAFAKTVGAGHQELGTTQRYMHLSPAALDAAIRLLESPGVPSKRGDILERDEMQEGKASS